MMNVFWEVHACDDVDDHDDHYYNTNDCFLPCKKTYALYIPKVIKNSVHFISFIVNIDIVRGANVFLVLERT